MVVPFIEVTRDRELVDLSLDARPQEGPDRVDRPAPPRAMKRATRPGESATKGWVPAIASSWFVQPSPSGSAAGSWLESRELNAWPWLKDFSQRSLIPFWFSSWMPGASSAASRARRATADLGTRIGLLSEKGGSGFSGPGKCRWRRRVARLATPTPPISEDFP